MLTTRLHKMLKNHSNIYVRSGLSCYEQYLANWLGETGKIGLRPALRLIFCINISFLAHYYSKRKILFYCHVVVEIINLILLRPNG